MVEAFQRIQQSTSASPARQVLGQNADPAPRNAAAEESVAEAAKQGVPQKVEDKVELKIEPEAVRQLRPNTHLKFVVSEDSNRVIVQIIQSDTNKVLREVPPKSLTEALAAMNSAFSR